MQRHFSFFLLRCYLQYGLRIQNLLEILYRYILLSSRFHRHGNGASIFTTSGIHARKFQNEVEAALVSQPPNIYGIQVPRTSIECAAPFRDLRISQTFLLVNLTNPCLNAGAHLWARCTKLEAKTQSSNSNVIQS